ncbi:DUF4139 domain-containing protein [Devosia sp. 2618]|uniref:DUF4139 domain-containing protein n=1 Tax=Devosia sp. 2618 TaxID=3156454 RepID=UPI0033962F51
MTYGNNSHAMHQQDTCQLARFGTPQMVLGSQRQSSPMPLRRVLLGACLAMTLPMGSAFAQDDTGYKIEAVTLSAGGLAEIRRGVHVNGTDALGFDVPIDQVSDILKSLLVYDPAGGVASITLDGPSAVDETFRGLPFTPDDMNALPTLLRSLQGISVRAASAGRVVEGMVLGVSGEQEGKDGEPLLSVMTKEGQIAVLKLRSDTQLDILDAAMREKLRAAATVSGKSQIEDMRAVTIALQGGTARDVWLDYVVPAPIWKTAYRLILDADGVARLQAWAVIENATGEDWSDVSLTLTSGAPVTLSQRLYDRYWHQRPEIAVLAQASAPPPPDQFKGMALEQSADMLNREMSFDMPVVQAAPAFAPAPISGGMASGPVAQAVAADGETAATYALPTPVNLLAGQTLSVPFIDTELSAERIALYRPELGDVHPISALRLKNTTGASLSPGIVTVYAPQEEGYAGDAQLMGVPSEESRMLSFASDRKVEVTTDRGEQQTTYRASVAKGVFRMTSTTRSETVYTIKGAQDAARTVIIEQPRSEGWTFSSPSLDEQTPTHYRLRASVEAGGTAEVRATIERTNSDEFGLVDADASSLTYWASLTDDPKVSAILADLIERRGELATIEQTVYGLDADLENASDTQARIRENLAAVPADSTLAQRYIASLEEQEDRIVDLEARRQQAQQQLTEKQQALADSVSDL